MYGKPGQGQTDKRKAVIDPLLEAKDWTPNKWATKAGLDPSVAYDYLAGKSNPRRENRRALAEALGLKYQDFPQ